MVSYLTNCFVLLVFLALTKGQPTVTNPSFEAYTRADMHTCGPDNPSGGEVIELTERCGTLLSPCFGVRNYPLEITEGLRLWYLNFAQPIAGLRLTANQFETNGINGILYIGRSVVMPTGIFGVARDFEIYGSLTGAAMNPFTFNFTTATGSTRDGNTFFFDNVETALFMSFYSSLEPANSGFNISFCLDVDMCADTTFCTNPARGTCVRNGFEEYSCNCMSTFTGARCETDVDECTPAPGACDPIAACTNSEGSFSCACPTGYNGNGIAASGGCTDIDECSDAALNNCSTTGSNCTNLPGSFACSCLAGFNGDGTDCVDINECETNNGGCGDTAMFTCTNEPAGSFTCGCLTGFINYPTCTNDNECSRNPCVINAGCTDNEGSFVCTCNAGYTGDGLVSCNDINECMPISSCDVNAMCENTEGSFICRCLDGYTGFGLPDQCADVDECANGDNNCDPNANCTNAIPSFICTCRNGWSGDGVTCVDINECAETSDDCMMPAEFCRNLMGSFECPCNEPEYRGTPGNCMGYFCAGNLTEDTVCNITGLIEWPTFFDGSMLYETNQDVTWFIDLSAESAVGIIFTIVAIDVQPQEDYIIFNNNSDYRVLQPVPLFFTGSTDAILSGNTTASETNPLGYNVTSQSFTINRDQVYVHFHSDRSTTFTGFQISYETGIDICTATAPCMNGGMCANEFVGYTCTCDANWTGRDCEIDVNECMDPNRCDPNATCTNTAGSFDCTCNSVFSGDGMTCRPDIVISNLEALSEFNMTSGITSVTVTFQVTPEWNTLDYIQNYVLTYTDSEGMSTMITTPFVNETNFNVITFDVTSFTNYTIELDPGENGTEISTATVSFSAFSIEITTADSLPLVPTDLTAAGEAVQTTLTWTAPDETGRGITTGYQVGTMRSADSCAAFGTIDQRECDSETMYTISTQNFATTMFVLTDLIPYREYSIRIRAETSAGFGNWSTPVIQFTGYVCNSSSTETGVPICPHTSGALLSENFPRPYPGFTRAFWLLENPDRDIRFVFDIFDTQFNQDYLDIGYGALPSPIATTDIRLQLTGPLGNTTAPIVRTSAETGGMVWARFESDIFTENRGFLMIYEQDIDSCSSSPCLMSGTCTDAVFDFTCTCPSLWSGKLCNIPLVTIDATCSSSASDSITVMWTNNRANDSSLISMYTVTYTSTTTGRVTENFPIGTSQASFSGFSPFENVTVTVEVVAVSPASQATTSTCEGQTQEAAPTAPTITAVTPATGPALDVTWSAPATLNGVLTQYTVNYQTTNHATFGESMASGSMNVTDGLTTQLTGLQAFRMYQVTVTATTGGGTGPASAPVTQTTPETAPTTGVSGVTVTVNTTHAVISYTAPTPVTGVFSYEVRYFVVGSISSQTVNSNNLMQTIAGLTPGVDYTFEVIVSTTAGNGPPTSATATTDEDIAGLVATPTFTSTNNSITVNWVEPVPPNGIITAYRVSWTPVTGTVGGTSDNLTGSTLSYTIEGLETYTEYTVTVFARTAVGENAGTVANQRTSEGVPRTGVSNIVFNPSATGVIVSYDAPSVVTGVFTFTLEYRIATESGLFTASSSATEITGLSTFTTYTVRVNVSTGAGAGPSEERNFTTAQDIPGDVTNPSSSAVTTTSATVQWEAPSTPNGIITEYFISWAVNGVEMEVAVAASVTTYEITGLQPFTTYMVTIVAATIAGNNTGSIVMFSTPGDVPDAPTLGPNINTDNSFNLTITPATPPRGDILYYEIRIRQNVSECTALGDSECYDVTQTLPASQTTFTTEVLPGFRSIIFSVRANTTAGFGPEATTTVTTEIVAAGTVTNVTLTPINSTAINVAWITARPVPGPSNYTITATDFAGQTSTFTVMDSDGTALMFNLTFAGLTQGSVYAVTVTQSTSVGSGSASPMVELTRPAAIFAGAQPNVSVTQNLLGASATQAFVMANPCNSVATFFTPNGGTIQAVDVIIRESGSSATTISYWAEASILNPTPQYFAATIPCSSPSGRKKRRVSDDGQTFVNGHDQTCDPSLVTTVCNGPLASGRSYEVAFRADTGAPEGKSGLTAFSAPVTTAVEAPPSGLTPGEIAAIVICSFIALLLIILLIYFCYRRRKGAGTYAPKGDDNGAFDDSGRQRYRVDPSVPAATSYTEPTEGPGEKLA